MATISLDTILPLIEAGEVRVCRTRDLRIDEYSSSGGARPVYDDTREQRVSAHAARAAKECFLDETPTIGKGGANDG